MYMYAHHTYAIHIEQHHVYVYYIRCTHTHTHIRYTHITIALHAMRTYVRSMRLNYLIGK